MTRARLLGLAAACLAAFAGACGDQPDPPIRIGVITSCGTLWGPFSEPMRAASALPLLARGATLAAERPSAGVAGAAVGDRKVELVFACSDGTTADMVAKSRHLAEQDGAAIVVGGVTPNEGLALQAVARQRPETAFLVVGNAQATTLHEPARNLFRFSSDAAQWMAGLGSHAYRELGWRRVALVADRNPFGYAQSAGFVAEFCSLGGRVVQRLWPPPETADFTHVAARVRGDVDGVVLAAGLITPGFLDAYRARGPLADRVVVGGGGLGDPGIVEALGARARGIVSAGPLPLDIATPAWTAYRARAERTFPSLPLTTHGLAVPYYVAVEAAMRALSAIGGDLSDGQRRLRRALTSLRMNAPGGAVRLDENRQAIAPNYVTRIGMGTPAHRTIRTIADVDQSFGGLFRPDGAPASRTNPRCGTGEPPRWAR
jgi:branched-chain amino acid transport system substrate-binding protein